MDNMATIGIDLGTTYSCVAYFNKSGVVEIITNDVGSRTTPSFVSYTEEERIVGSAAKAMAVDNLKDTVFDVKRLIGRNFSDPVTQEDIKTLPYTVVERGGQPQIQVSYLGKTHTFRPEEVSSVILSYLKTQAENAIGEKVANAVITVPAYFNDAQRQATKDAGTLAGLNVLRIINEPTAACMCYGWQKCSTEKTILVFDLGGGTFDVSLLTVASEEGVYEVLATAGDTHLGGEDFDNVLADYLVSEYERQTGTSLKSNVRARRQIKIEAESAKRTLSNANMTTVSLSQLGGSCSVKLSRAKFNALCAPVFKRILAPIEKVLADANRKPADVDEIVLVGGSSRIPKVQEMLTEYFGKALNSSINPDEAVAYGAAIYGARLTGQKECQDIQLLDVASLSLGVETNGGLMDVIIPRQKTIPCKEPKTYYTARDNQTSVLIQVYEGERALTKDNNKLGEFELSGLPPRPKHTVGIQVTFSLDTDGILSVSAVETSTGQSRTITITNNKGRLSKEELAQKLAEAEEFKKSDDEARDRAKERAESEEYLYAVRNSAEKITGLTAADQAELETIVTAGIDWLNANPTASAADIRKMRHDSEASVEPIYNRASAGASTGTGTGASA